MTNSAGHLVDIGEHVIRLPDGWSVTQFRGVTLCGRHDLKQRVALTDLGPQALEDIPIEGQRSPFSGVAFFGHLEEDLISPSWIERLLFGRKPHYRFEWGIQHNDFRLLAVYLSEPEEDRSLIKARIEELLSALQVEG
jgi:hypothetical protein